MCDPSVRRLTRAVVEGPDSAEQEFGELKFTKNVTVMNRRLKYIESTGVQAVTVDAKDACSRHMPILRFLRS